MTIGVVRTAIGLVAGLGVCELLAAIDFGLEFEVYRVPNSGDGAPLGGRARGRGHAQAVLRDAIPVLARRSGVLRRYFPVERVVRRPGRYQVQFTSNERSIDLRAMFKAQPWSRSPTPPRACAALCRRTRRRWHRQGRSSLALPRGCPASTPPPCSSAPRRTPKPACSSVETDRCPPGITPRRSPGPRRWSQAAASR